MNIKIAGFRSALNYNDNLNNITGSFVRDIARELGEDLVESDLSDYDCDLKLIFIQSGGSEGLFLQNLDKLQEPYYFLTNGSNNSLAASLEIMTYLNIHGKKGEILHGDIQYIAGRIRKLALVGRIRHELAKARFGVFGKPSDWLIASVPEYKAVKERLGITFEDVLLEDVKKLYEETALVDVSKLPAAFDKDEKLKAMRVYEAFRKIAEERSLNGFTVRCFDLLGPLRTTGCVGLSLLNDKGITSTCEGDIAALISMHIARLLTGESNFQANPSRISTEDNTVVFAHCTLPLGMTERYALDTHFESGTGVAVKGYLKESEVTVFRISADLKRFFVSNGRIVKNLEEPDLCRTQILVRLQENVEDLLKHPCGNHHIIFYGYHADEIRTLMENLFG